MRYTTFCLVIFANGCSSYECRSLGERKEIFIAYQAAINKAAHDPEYKAILSRGRLSSFTESDREEMFRILSETEKQEMWKIVEKYTDRVLRKYDLSSEEIDKINKEGLGRRTWRCYGNSSFSAELEKSK